MWCVYTHACTHPHTHTHTHKRVQGFEGHEPPTSFHGLAINLSLLQTPTFQFVWPHCVTGTNTERNTMQSLKRRYAVTCGNIDEPRGHYTNWNKPNTEIQVLQDLAYMWNLKKFELTETESRMVVISSWRMREMGRCCSKVQTFSYKMSKSWKANVAWLL